MLTFFVTFTLATLILGFLIFIIVFIKSKKNVINTILSILDHTNTYSFERQNIYFMTFEYLTISVMELYYNQIYCFNCVNQLHII